MEQQGESGKSEHMKEVKTEGGESRKDGGASHCICTCIMTTQNILFLRVVIVHVIGN